ncbi:sugar phosphate nucleotidyltransferase [Plesiomonas shigelloides subsp. oncorhynchi]|nr:sugar phosphate nucleotidyltransferase [Plesiomonas shigelloides]
MAGGFGTRLKPLTDTCPKPMLKVGDKPILEILLRQVVEAGFRNVYISTHYMPERIRSYFDDGYDWGCSITYVHEENPLGTGGALGLLPNTLPDLPVIMINGDVLTKVDLEQLLNFHVEHEADATMCVREYDYQIPYGVIKGRDTLLLALSRSLFNGFCQCRYLRHLSECDPLCAQKSVSGYAVVVRTTYAGKVSNSYVSFTRVLVRYWSNG